MILKWYQNLTDLNLDLTNNTYFDPTKPFKITFWTKQVETPYQPLTYLKQYDLDFIFKEFNDIIEIKPTEENGCFTFDNFKFKSDINVEGLCVSPFYKLKYPNLVYNNNILPIDVLPYNNMLNSPIYNINKPSANYCLDLITTTILPPGNYPNPVPLGCIEFDMEITLLPCEYYESDPNCPPLVLNKKINICCSCDIRPSNPNN